MLGPQRRTAALISGELMFAPGARVLVTGAASGIGRQLVVDAATLGLDVVAWDIAADGLELLEEEGQAADLPIACDVVDVTDRGKVRAAMRAVTSNGGSPTYVVNNAGPSSFAQDDFDGALMAAVGSVERVTGAWLESGPPEGAALVNVSSVCGTTVGSAQATWYPPAKAAIAGLTRAVAVQHAPSVRANAVAFGAIATPRTDAFLRTPRGAAIVRRTPLGRPGSASEASGAILLLLSPLASFVNGALLVVDGGATLTF